MKVFIVCMFCCVLAQGDTLPPPFFNGCVTNGYPPARSQHPVPTYSVNLDQIAEERWRPVLAQYSVQVRAVLDVLLDLFGHGAARDFASLIADLTFGEVEKLLPFPYNEEIKGASLATGLSIGKIVLYNIFYEVNPLCTSIVAQDKAGNVLHARNQDFGLFMGWDTKTDDWLLTEALRNVTIRVNFTRGNGHVVYSAVTFAGYVGALTLVKPGQYSMSYNARQSGENFGNIFAWYRDHRERQFIGFVARDLMEKADGYDAARQFLQNVQLISPIYFILGGVSKGQGSVITRNQTGALDTWDMANNTWYVLETNYDRWEQPPIFDDRRTPAESCMNRTGQANMTLPALFNVLTTKPVLNKATVYTTLMSARTGHFESYKRTCPDPCWPF